MIEFMLGIGTGLIFGIGYGKFKYQELLVVIARAKSAEKLPDGKFYYIIPEGETK